MVAAFLQSSDAGCGTHARWHDQPCDGTGRVWLPCSACLPRGCVPTIPCMGQQLNGAAALGHGNDPHLIRRLVGRAHELFVSGLPGNVGTSLDNVRSVVLDSWHRSATHGVDPLVAAPPLVLSESALAEARQRNPMSSVLPVIRDLLTTAAGEAGHVVAVGDATGRLLWVEGDRRRRSEVEAMGFAAGTLWSESSIGTNAPGTALALDRPVQIFAAEHFVSTMQALSCTAVPVHNPTDGSVIGVIDVTGDEQTVSGQSLALVRATVAAAEATLLAVHYRADGSEQLNVGTDTEPVAPWRLEVLGRNHADLIRTGQRTRLSTRHSELLLLLSMHPRGLSADHLGSLLHEHDVPSVTIRAELTRLRRLLGSDALLSRPYRLGLPIETDLSEVITLVSQGDLAQALRKYSGPVLPQSDSPAIAEVRFDTTMRIRRAALATDDADAVLAFASTGDGGNDVELLHRALTLLPPRSPRRPAVEARIAVLNHLYG